MARKSILFVCTGNVFRSVTVEQCFKKYLSDNGIKDWTVGSAGTLAPEESIHSKVLETLREFGISDFEHQQKKLTLEMLETHDAIVCMAENHLEFMRSEFRYKHALLFNDLALGEQTSIWDVEDDVPDYATNPKAVEKKLEHTVREIHDKIPKLFKNASERFYLFSDFVDGKITHRNGYPFITLYETPNSIAFMSIDIPYKEDGHILVIPKKRYFDLSLIPDDILGEILVAIKRVGRAVGAEHGGYNVLLNNGLDAGQYIFHTHFHIIPRRHGDDIKIEGWKRHDISREDFIRLNDKLKQQIDLTLT
ncbi:MAG TPA: HIT domain-containing protein [Candidatus Paceibacterota bacterium]